MTQEQKDLLLKDLCARLPYGVVVKDRNGVHILTSGNTEFIDLFNGKCNIKPHLFPLSSMTNEQKKEYRKACELDTERLSKHPMDGTPFPALYNSQDWLSKHHFDYRGLIPMDLALDATGLNIY